MCKANGESVDHLVLHYAVARKFRPMVFPLIRIFQVMLGGGFNVLLGNHFSRYWSSMIWNTVTICLK